MICAAVARTFSGSIVLFRILLHKQNNKRNNTINYILWRQCGLFSRSCSVQVRCCPLLIVILYRYVKVMRTRNWELTLSNMCQQNSKRSATNLGSPAPYSPCHEMLVILSRVLARIYNTDITPCHHAKLSKSLSLDFPCRSFPSKFPVITA